MPALKTRSTKLSNTKCLEKLSEYFERIDGNATCKIVDCNSKLCRFTAFYLKRHIRAKHFSIFKELFEKEVESEIEQTVNAFETTQNAVTLVTSNGYPLSLLSKPAFRFLIQPRLDDLANNGHGVVINRTKILDDIDVTSNAIRVRIKNELQKVCLYSIMMDLTTKSTLSVLGLSASFTRNDNVVTRPLGVIQMKKRHTGDNIADLVESCLKTYDLSINRIFTVTSDNGSNMLKTTRVLNDMVMSDREGFDNVNVCEQSQLIDTEEDLESDSESEDDTNGSCENELNQRFSAIVSDMAHNMTLQNEYIALIPQVRCCAHTLQLAIHDAITDSNARRVIGRVREMCKSLRNQVINTEFRRMSPKTVLPPLDNATRWCSEYVMVCFYWIDNAEKSLELFQLFVVVFSYFIGARFS